MINNQMRSYDYFTFGKENAYGQKELSQKQGTIKMSINLTSQSIQDNINYANSQYVGLTRDKAVSDTMVIQYGDKKLKVLYVNPIGRMTQVFLNDYQD